MISGLRQRSRSHLLLILAVVALFGPTAAHAQRAASPLPVAPPESAGMSAARLARLTALFGKEVEDRKLPAFKDVKVSTDSGEVAAQRTMIVQDLLRHTAGLPYGELTQNAAVNHRGIFRQLVYQAIAD
jgi:hypothetical protein